MQQPPSQPCLKASGSLWQAQQSWPGQNLFSLPADCLVHHHGRHLNLDRFAADVFALQQARPLQMTPGDLGNSCPSILVAVGCRQVMPNTRVKMYMAQGTTGPKML